MVRNTRGQVTRLETGSVLPIEMTYDTSGRLLAIAQGDRLLSNTYVADGVSAGYLESSTDSLLQSTVYERDALGRTLSLTDASDAVTSFSWDGLGNLASLTPPDRAPHLQSFDGVGQQTSYLPLPRRVRRKVRSR
jgi:YD repeat-containing protein